MTNAAEYKTRLLIPRWLTFDVASSLGELRDISTQKEPSIYNPRTYASNQIQWQNNKSIPFAVELVSAGLLINDFANPLVIEAANFILKNRNKTSHVAAEMAARAIGASENNLEFSEPFQYIVDNEAIRGKIAALKHKCREYSANAISWSDLSFYYSMLGQKEQAKKAMTVALSIGPDNRFILRSAARLFNHYGQPDFALKLLRSTNISKSDPWIIASEISISESIKKTSKRTNEAKKLIDSLEKFDFNSSELLSSLGTLEFSHGAIKKCKKLIRSSLISPTENSIAQAEWLSGKVGTKFQTAELASGSFEAQTLNLFNNKQYFEAVKACNKWLRFQPFSSMPAINGSYLASVALEDYKSAINFCEVGLQSSPNEFMLLNNYAFALLNDNRLEDAEVVLNRTDVSDLDDRSFNTHTATMGLLKYKHGQIEEARDLYAQSTEGFIDSKNKKALAIALAFWAEAEKGSDDEFSQALFSKARELATKEKMYELLYRLDKSKPEFLGLK